MLEMLTKVPRDEDIINTALTSGVIMGVVWGQNSSLWTREVTSTGRFEKEKEASVRAQLTNMKVLTTPGTYWTINKYNCCEQARNNLTLECTLRTFSNRKYDVNRQKWCLICVYRIKKNNLWGNILALGPSIHKTQSCKSSTLLWLNQPKFPSSVT